MQILHKTSPDGGRPVVIYNLDVVVSVPPRRRIGFGGDDDTSNRMGRSSGKRKIAV